MRTHTKFGIKIFEIDFVIEIKWYLTFWPIPKAPGGGTKKIFYVARSIHVSNSHTKLGWIWSNGLGGDSITDRQQDGIWFWPLSTPKSYPWAWPRQQNKKPGWYVLYLSFVRTHTKFWIKIFEIDFVIEIKWFLTFWPLPRAPGGGAKKKYVARHIHVSNSRTKFGWISSNGLGGDSITDGRTDGRTEAITTSPSLF